MIVNGTRLGKCTKTLKLEMKTHKQGLTMKILCKKLIISK